MRALRSLVTLLVVSASLLLASTGQAVNGHANYHAVCPGAEALAARCHADVVTDANGNPNATISPTGYGPAQFHGGYSLPTTAPSLKTIAIVGLSPRTTDLAILRSSICSSAAIT